LGDYGQRCAQARTCGRFAAAASIVALWGAVLAGGALAAYPPHKGPLPKAKCAISTIVDRRVAMSCNAGTPRAGKPCSFVVDRSVVARGRVARNGRYSARFTTPTLLRRGTHILFVVQGKTLVSVRV
jgi:hypothetical protein